ncbi:hypothetical protein ACFSDD_22590 [Salipiger marinus]|uniref:hypothetical protein n=1 Tax=Salipiger marinus TaxID=555512 RepID=UPI002C68394C|nr:hypothetical protein [Salipiger manganoxidans]MEB3422101.1 hypothetical protein [Salipiger manganoxidans]
MLEWLSRHSDALQVIMSGVTAGVWVVYLQVFLVSFRHQRRPEIIISLGAGAGAKACWFVSNLGLESIFVVDVMVRFETTSGVTEAVVTDRTEMNDRELSSPAEATNQGPLASGDFMSIGTFETLLARTEVVSAPAHDLKSVTIVVVAATAARWSLVGASRHYRIVFDKSGAPSILSTMIYTHQIHGRRGRQDLIRKLESRLG